MAIDPQGTLYAAGVVSNLVYRRPRGASRWEPISENGPTGAITSLAVDPVTSTLYVGAGNGAFKYTGKGWQNLLLPTNSWVYAIAVARHLNPLPGEPEYELYVLAEAESRSFGGYRAIFMGFEERDELRWTDTRVPTTGYLGALTLALRVGRQFLQTSLYVGLQEGGVVFNTALPSLWAPLNVGLRNLWVGGLALSPKSGSVYVGTVGSGAFIQPEAGGPWISTTPGYFFETLASDPAAPATVYGISFARAYRSTNGGITWAIVGRLGSDGIWSVAVAPREQFVLATGYGRIFLYTGNDIWVDTGFNYPYNATTLLIDPKTLTIYVGTEQHGVWTGTYQGGRVTWKRIDLPGLTSQYIHALALDSSNGTLWAGTEGGVFKRAPGEGQWTPLPLFGHETDLSALAVDPATGGVVAGTRKDGVQIWDGERWQPGRGLSNPQVWTLIVDPRTTPSSFYAGTLGNGLYASTDGGRTWR